jgi:hypothetical protein
VAAYRLRDANHAFAPTETTVGAMITITCIFVALCALLALETVNH